MKIFGWTVTAEREREYPVWADDDRGWRAQLTSRGSCGQCHRTYRWFHHCRVAERDA